MEYNDDIWPIVRAHSWKWEPRSAIAPFLIIIHATRSGIVGRTPAQEYISTINWFSTPNNGIDQNGDAVKDWGGMASVIVGGGKICRVLPEDAYPTWSAGHMDRIGLSIEIAQATVDTPFATDDFELAAQQTAEWCKKYSIPVRVLQFVSEDNHEAPGISRHDHSANGRSYQKSDPGYNFNEQWFIVRVKHYLQEEEHMASAEYTELNTKLTNLQTWTRAVDKVLLDEIKGIKNSLTFARGLFTILFERTKQHQADTPPELGQLQTQVEFIGTQVEILENKIQAIARAAAGETDG